MPVVSLNGKPLRTPAKLPLEVSSPPLAEAIAEEWAGRKSFNAAVMPLTALAYTAIDRIGDEKDNIIEILLAYVDTDTLCYRSNTEELHKRQKAEWDPVLAWAGSKFSALWQTTSGVMPIEQPQALHETLRNYLGALDSMHLAAASVLASLYSSLVLALAVVEKQMPAEKAFALSRLEETFQAEAWGKDEEAEARRKRISEEISAIARFLRLLQDA